MPFWRRRRENKPHVLPEGWEWVPPDDAEVLVLTFILELPQDLKHPQDKAFGLTEERDDVFVDWPDEAKTIVTRVPITTPGRSPVCRLVFRNGEVKMPLPLQAADFAFGEWTRPFFNDEAWEERNRVLEEAEANIGLRIMSRQSR